MIKISTDEYTVMHTISQMLHGYQDPVFGRGDLGKAFDHGTGLFFPELTKKSQGTGDAVACTFAFQISAGDPTVAERIEYLKTLLAAADVTPACVNFYVERGQGAMLDQLSAYDSAARSARQIIEFKFNKSDEDAARAAILGIDKAAGGRISKRLGVIRQERAPR